MLAAACGPDQPRFEQSAVTTTTSAVPAVPEPSPPSPPPSPPSAPAQPSALVGARVVVSPRGVVVPVVGAERSGLRVMTPCGNSAVLAEGTPVREAAVVLDAGHGGSESGAVGANRLTEKALNLAVVGHARAALDRAGIPVVLTRTADYRMTLAVRAQVATALQPRAFVSVHHNAVADGPSGSPGSEVYYQIGSADSRRLAGLLYEEIVAALSRYDVPWVADTDAGAKYRPGRDGGDYYGILRRSRPVPAVLAELAFISNPPEAELLARPDVQAVAGAAVARGILRYLTTADPGSGFTEPYPREPTPSGGGAEGCVDPPL